MPAVTADPTILPRLPRVDPAASVSRPVQHVIDAPTRLEGEGFQVRRPFPGIDLYIADPFVLLDHLGAVEYAPGEAKGAPDHPHRGFETVTYIIDGAIEHRDSTGGGGLISDGATQWMTAGAGIVHSEMPPQELVTKGGLFHGTQLWVNLPAAQKWTPPRYQDIRADSVKLVASPDGGAIVRVIAGEVGGHAGPGSTHTPIAYAHATLSPTARLDVPWRTDFNALVYVLAGAGSAGDGVGARPIREGQLAVLGGGDHVTVTAGADMDGPSATLEVLLLGGRPIREPIAAYGPFVMNTREEIIDAITDYQAGRMGRIPPIHASVNAFQTPDEGTGA
jgi:redox-sensitive bicupin YhaK (pirin superfamily)